MQRRIGLLPTASCLLHSDTFEVLSMAKENREKVWLQCTETGDLNYRTEIKVAGGAQKVEVKKYCTRAAQAHAAQGEAEVSSRLQLHGSR